MKIQIQPSAVGDLRAGFRFYEKRAENLGGYFLDSLFSDIDSLALYAGVHPIHLGKFHRLLSVRFPYAIYYELKNEWILVRAVLDLRRDPAWIIGKLKRLD